MQPHSPLKNASELLRLAHFVVTTLGTQAAGETAAYLLALVRGETGGGQLIPLPCHEQGRSQLLAEIEAALDAPAAMRTILPAAMFRALIR